MTNNKDFNLKAKLDRAGSRLVKVSGLSPFEEKVIASSPFLYARLRANITSELERQDAPLWASLSRVSRKAIPGMAIAAAFSFGLFLYVNGNKTPNQPFSVDAYLGAGESRIDNMLFAERRPLTADEVLTTIVSRDEREATR